MHDTLCLESSDLARELHAFLQTIDPARWRSDMQARARGQLEQVRSHLKQILESYEMPEQGSHMHRLYEGLESLSQQLEQWKPRADESTARMRQEWHQLQRALQPTYTTVAASLDRLAKPAPALRPTNYGRNLFHLANSLMCLALVQYVLSPGGLIITALAMAMFAWSVEALRVYFPVVTRISMVFLGRFAHPHEHYRVNSSTWYCTALAVMALAGDLRAASVALVVLGVADPMAALVGRRYGRTKLRGGRTLEGTAAFVVSGAVASLVMLAVYYPAVSLYPAVVIALCGATLGALAELFSGRVDDNFTIPLAATVGASLAAQLLAV